MVAGKKSILHSTPQRVRNQVEAILRVAQGSNVSIALDFWLKTCMVSPPRVGFVV